LNGDKVKEYVPYSFAYVKALRAFGTTRMTAQGTHSRMTAQFSRWDPSLRSRMTAQGTHPKMTAHINDKRGGRICARPYLLIFIHIFNALFKTFRFSL
jgi:hypothetical protein